MTEQRYRNAAAAPPVSNAVATPPVPPRHRRDGGAGLGSWLPVADRRGILVGGGALAVILVLVAGYLLLGRAGDPPPRTEPGAQPAPGVIIVPPPTSAAPSGTPSGSAGPAGSQSPPADAPGSPEPSRSRPAGDGRTSPSPERHSPRLVGPRSADGFETLLVNFCKKRGFRTALLLNGKDDSPRTGNWVCAQVITFETLNLNDACRDAFGDEAQARQLDKGDSRTWRCFDS